MNGAASPPEFYYPYSDTVHAILARSQNAPACNEVYEYGMLDVTDLKCMGYGGSYGAPSVYIAFDCFGLIDQFPPMPVNGFPAAESFPSSSTGPIAVDYRTHLPFDVLVSSSVATSQPAYFRLTIGDGSRDVQMAVRLSRPDTIRLYATRSDATADVLPWGQQDDSIGAGVSLLTLSAADSRFAAGEYTVTVQLMEPLPNSTISAPIHFTILATQNPLGGMAEYDDAAATLADSGITAAVAALSLLELAMQQQMML